MPSLVRRERMEPRRSDAAGGGSATTSERPIAVGGRAGDTGAD
jgi:hypothetical protein